MNQRGQDTYQHNESLNIGKYLYDKWSDYPFGKRQKGTKKQYIELSQKACLINYPEVAILGIGRSYKKQLFVNEKFVPRTILPLSLSYDHRIIDGAEAARFNNDLKDNLGSNFAYKLAI